MAGWPASSRRATVATQVHCIIDGTVDSGAAGDSASKITAASNDAGLTRLTMALLIFTPARRGIKVAVRLR